MADSVGSVNLFALRGVPVVLSRQVIDLTNESLDGTAKRLCGLHAGQWTADGEDDQLTWADAHGLTATYAALVGTIQTVVIGGVSYANQMVLAADVVKVHPGLIAAGGRNGGAYWAESKWVFQYAGAN